MKRNYIYISTMLAPRIDDGTECEWLVILWFEGELLGHMSIIRKGDILDIMPWIVEQIKDEPTTVYCSSAVLEEAQQWLAVNPCRVEIIKLNPLALIATLDRLAKLSMAPRPYHELDATREEKKA